MFKLEAAGLLGRSQSSLVESVDVLQVKWSGSQAEYSLEGEFPEMLFTISREGVIYLNAPLDRETQDQVCGTFSSSPPALGDQGQGGRGQRWRERV